MLLKGLSLLVVASIAAGVAIMANLCALIPFRRARGEHWTERARLLWPARNAAAANQWLITAMLAFAAILIGSELMPPWQLVAIAALSGAVLGAIPIDRIVFPRIAVRDLFRLAACAYLMHYFIVFSLLVALIIMPRTFSIWAAVFAVGVLMLQIVWNRDGMVWAGRRLGLIIPAPERLRQLAVDTAAQMKVPFREVFLVRWPMAQAIALIDSRRLLFTERLVELLTEDELGAICAHELGHLTESRAAQFVRQTKLLAFMPWLFLKPLVYLIGAIAVLGLFFTTFLFLRMHGEFSRKMEQRADRIVTGQEIDPGTFARALMRIHEDGLIPAVLAQKSATHPDLFNRLFAAGVTPDFPRPEAPRSRSGYSSIFSWLFACVLAILVIAVWCQPE